jgi:hypothetical protein
MLVEQLNFRFQISLSICTEGDVGLTGLRSHFLWVFHFVICYGTDVSIRQEKRTGSFWKLSSITAPWQTLARQTMGNQFQYLSRRGMLEEFEKHPVPRKTAAINLKEIEVDPDITTNLNAD